MEINDSQISTGYLNALLAGKRKKAQQLCNSYIQSEKSLKELYENVMKPALYEVGKLWEQNKISVAAEHLATAITEGILNSFYADVIPEKYSGKKVVLACVDKEEHQVGIKMVADVFEMNKWESFFLGTGFPTSELIKYIKEVQPDVVALSLSVYFNFAQLKLMLNKLKSEFPEITIIIGGQALAHATETTLAEWKDILLFSDLYELDNYLRNLK
ncbi:B12-binding domain-containing protein [uncultured Draconibacterium sp.]|uniref:cobalamin B12-binding domain-containing protein n=1 Tax=uncultured Draconibacterium sp. TaxID=1573823 RepID=UPI0025F1223E|nr:B12-binding domain-containing protein [uncultured Draconibacterium sp.]